MFVSISIPEATLRRLLQTGALTAEQLSPSDRQSRQAIRQSLIDSLKLSDTRRSRYVSR